MKHQPQVGLDFLRWLYPNGPWLMTAINTEQTETPSRTFHPGQEDQFAQWLERNYDRNIYYSVNRPLRDMSKKAERVDIAEMGFLHVDVDPRTNENFEEEKSRIEDKFTNKLPTGLPKPSALVFSGGGYNALWRLDEAIPIALGDLTLPEIEARYEDAKRYNLQLEILLQGDNCHNIDRILRLPGSVNWPTTKKKAKGRVADYARVVWLEDSKYSINRFVAAPNVQAKGMSSSSGGMQIQISGNIKRLGTVAELGDQVPDRVKMIIVQGYDPDEPNKFPGRSEWLFYVCCSLVRAGCTNETIYSVITDPGFLISASVLDKGATVERYALRNIKRAREHAVDPQLCRLNEKHHVISNTGGKCRVMEEVMDFGLNRPRLTLQAFEDFRNRYVNERMQVGSKPDGTPIFKDLGSWWLQHPQRSQFEAIVFVPGREIPGSYNMWTGFSCVATPGDKHHSFLNHIKEIACGGNEVYYDYLIKWMARAVQHPDTQGEVAVVFRGEMGAGKGTVAVEFGKLWGRHFLQISDPKHLVGSFNAHLRDVVIVFADEAFYAGDKKHESILKTLITEDMLTIEGKHKDMETSRNYVHLMMASNSNWVVPAGPRERRYLVLDVLDTKVRNFAHFDKVRKDMDNGGRENFLHFLLTIDLTNFKVRDVPDTEGLRDQKLLSFSVEQEWWFRKLEEGTIMPGHAGWQAPVFKDLLVDDYLNQAQRQGIQRRSNATALGRFLHGVVPGLQHKQVTKHNGGERPYAWFFPTLGECRKHWDEKFGGPYSWPKLEVQEQSPPQTEQQF